MTPKGVNLDKKARQLRGVVVSAKANKTRTVLVLSTKVHPKYGRRFKTSKKFAAHDETNQYQPGDKVVIAATRPLSRTKRWRIVKKIS